MDGHDFFNYDRTILFNAIYLSAGESVPPHKHDEYPHDCFVLRGTVRLAIGSTAKELDAPSTVHFPNGAIHGFTAMTDAILICTHPADKALS